MSMILDGSNGVTFNDASLQGAAASPYVLKNRIINGDMVIDQRNAGASVVNNDNTYCLDRYVMRSTIATTYTVQQNAGSVTPPAGFNNYLGLTSTSSYSFTGNQYFGINQYIEGYNVADLNWGTANAKTITVSFWARSSLTGNFDLTIWNDSFARGYVTQYTISAANTWTYITVTIPGDTSGTWPKTTATGLALFFSIGASGTYATSTLNTWGSAYTGSTTGTKVVSTNGATFYITGVQLEQNTSATPFERRLYGQELANCQRYFQVLGKGLNGSPAYVIFSILTYEAPATAWGTVPLKVTMRTQPTTTYSGTFTTSYGNQGPLLNDTNQTGPDNGVIGWAVGSGGTTGYSTYLRASNSTAAFISFSAEL
jgi:hypothetical protein